MASVGCVNYHPRGVTVDTTKSARDRLRQEILEQKGWNLYRIWSTDWFSNPDREVMKLTCYIRELIES
jgi:very-short-patch-repair endonuclease